MSSIKIACTISFFALLSACSIFEPFIDRRRNAGQSEPQKIYIGKSTPDKPAVCSNNLWTKPERIQALADAECIKHKQGSHAVQTGTSRFSCKLLLPTHTYFKCEQ